MLTIMEMQRRSDELRRQRKYTVHAINDLDAQINAIQDKIRPLQDELDGLALERRHLAGPIQMSEIAYDRLLMWMALEMGADQLGNGWCSFDCCFKPSKPGGLHYMLQATFKADGLDEDTQHYWYQLWVTPDQDRLNEALSTIGPGTSRYALVSVEDQDPPVTAPDFSYEAFWSQCAYRITPAFCRVEIPELSIAHAPSLDPEYFKRLKLPQPLRLQ